MKKKSSKKNKPTSTDCPPDEVALKSFFLGPQAENSEFLKKEIAYILESWIDWRKTIFPQDGQAIPFSDRNSPSFQKKLKLFQHEVQNVSDLFQNEIPKFSPRYIGHMLSELSMPALLGHLVCLLHNPNNISKESSLVGVEIEKAAIQDLGLMLGYAKDCVGHFTSGGSVANFEAVIRAKSKWLKNLQNGSDTDLSQFSDFELGQWYEKNKNQPFQSPVLLVPANKHYSWNKAANYFGLGKNNLRVISLDKKGALDIFSLKKEINFCLKNKKPILAVVSVCGSTELASIDPIHEVQEILIHHEKKEGLNLWHHIDAAYGGFFSTLKNINSPSISKNLKDALQAIPQSTSLTIDPHKLGYVPYASGAFICRKADDYFVTETKAPYLDFKNQRDRGPYTIEGSRSAAGAVATYLTSKCIGFNEAGYGSIIRRSIESCALMKESLAKSKMPILFVETDPTNILCFGVGKAKMRLSKVNAQTQKVIEAFHENSLKHDDDTFYLSKTTLQENFSLLICNFCRANHIQQDTDHLLVIRLTMMNPFLNSKHTKTNFIKQFTRSLDKTIKNCC